MWSELGPAYAKHWWTQGREKKIWWRAWSIQSCYMLQNHAIQKKLFSAQRLVALRIVSAYRTISMSAVLVLASVPPIDLLAEERQETFQLRKELTCADLQEMRWHGEQTGRWTYRLIPELATWLNRKHGEVGFYLAQALLGHACFNAYLRRFKKRDEETCCYCDFPVDNAEHALFVCAKWGVDREVLGQAVGSELTPDTMVPLMLQSERFWTLIESFITLVMKTRVLDGRRERKNGEGQ